MKSTQKLILKNFSTILTFCCLSEIASAQYISLQGDRIIKIDPQTLEIKLDKEVSISLPQTKMPVNIKDKNSRKLVFIRGDFIFTAESQGSRISLHIENQSKKSSKLIFPSLESKDSFLLPMLEGLRVSIHNKPWINYIENRMSHSRLEMVEAFSFPAWGVQNSDLTVSYVVENPLETELVFHKKKTSLGMDVINLWPKNDLNRTVTFYFDWSNNTELAPAHLYRSLYFNKTDTLTEKVKKNPKVKSLYGAFHFYVWGGNIIEEHNILNWLLFAREFSKAKEGSYVNTIYKNLNSSFKNQLNQIALLKEMPPLYQRREIAESVSLAISKTDEHSLKLTKSEARYIQKKRHLFAKGFSKAVLEEPQNWGSAVSPWMIQELKKSGIEHAWLGVIGFEDANNHLEFVESASRHGYLLGAYDSYHSMHDPQNPLWSTANLGHEAYKKGRVIDEEGQESKGFLGKGFHVNSKYIRPFFEKRTSSQLALGFTSWFIDCDGAGELFSHYGKEFPMTQAEDKNERISRLKWLEKQNHIVVGTEGARSYIIPAVHFAHGTLTPPFTYSFKSLFMDKQSKNYIGGWYPHDKPAIVFKETSIPEEEREIFYDSRFQIPLFERAFHDQIISTHHWEIGTLKFKNTQAENILRELLYGVPPLFHLNREEWMENGRIISRYYAMSGNFLKAVTGRELLEFSVMTENRLVQKTVFKDGLEVIANFSPTDIYSLNLGNKKINIPALSALLVSKEKTQLIQVQSILKTKKPTQ